MLALMWAGYCASAQTEQNTAAEAASIPADDTPEAELAPVTVSAHEGVAVPYDNTGVSVTLLDVTALKNSGIHTLSEALTKVPGVYIMPGGGSYQKGNYSKPVVRGLSSEKYLLPMMDGMRLGGLNGATGLVGGNAVARTALDGIGTLEIVRGTQGAVYGSGALSGVLYMETPEGSDTPSLTLFNEYGSFDSYTGSATAQGRSGDTAFFFNTTYERTNNDVRFADGSGATLKHAGKSTNLSEALRVDQELSKQSRLTLTYRREDADYRYYSPAYESYGWVSPADLTLYNFRTNLATAKLQCQLSRAYSTSLMVGYYSNVKELSPTRQVLSNVQAEWRNAYRWNDAQNTTFGLAWTRSDFESTTVGQRNASSSSLDSTLSVFAEHNAEVSKNWHNALALRYDYSNIYTPPVTLRASSAYKFNSERTRLFGSVGHGYAAPSSFQRSRASFNDGYTTYYGNPHLECETSWSADMGVEHVVADRHKMSATLFWLRTEDAIVNQFSDDYRECHYRNAASHRTNQGVELALSGSWSSPANVGYRVAYTLTQPKEAGDTQVPHSARQVWTADVYLSPEPDLVTGLGLSAAVGRCDWSGRRLDNYVVLRWYINYRLSEQMSVYLRVENLTNQRFVLDDSSMGPSADWVNPGTAVYVGCTVKF